VPKPVFPTSITLADLHALHAGLSEVAAACDGARRLDGVGFSRHDADNGRFLIHLGPAGWSKEDQCLAAHLVIKYQRQIPDRVVTVARNVMYVIG
jgi:hypothetical protein